MVAERVVTIKSVDPSRILVIDDQRSNLLLVEHALSYYGYPNCVCDQDPVHAVDRFRKERFDLVILDFNMPGMSGMEVLAEIGSVARRDFVPIVMLTAQADRDTRLMMLNAGAREFITKPFDIAELGIRVANLLEARAMKLALRDQKDDLEIRVTERTKELHDTRLEIIRRLAIAAEFRDSDTGLHVQRMSLYAEATGRTLGLDSREIDLLLNTSPMHDVGKIGISDLILLKPGKLTEQEFAEMKRHTVIGGQILGGHDSDLFRAAHDIALHHHEKWDGSGYPHGLAGEAIPLFARIAAVADVFDALTAARPYKQAWSTTDAFAYIKEQAGRQFDPDVVQAFLSSSDTILSVRAGDTTKQSIQHPIP